MPKGRDSKVRFIKSSVPWDKGADSGGIIFTCRFCGQRKHIEKEELSSILGNLTWLTFVKGGMNYGWTFRRG